MGSELEPNFTPGSGWYRLKGNTAPDSAADVADRQEAAYRCVVFRMRLHGVRLRPDEIIVHHFFEGGLLLNDQYTHPAWHAKLFKLPDMRTVIVTMHDAKLKRSKGGFRQYQGWEWDEKAFNKYPQTWFCAPSHEAGIAVLTSMPSPDE